MKNGFQAYLITVNRRLARTLKTARAQGTGPFAQCEGRILAWEDFISELFEFQRCHVTPTWPLSPLQEHMLWASAMENFPTLGFAREQTIESARDAYALIMAYQLPVSSLKGYKEDADLFVGALERFEEACAQHHAFPRSAMIQQLLSDASFLQSLSIESIQFYGFDEWTPAQQGLIDHLEKSGTSITVMTQSGRENQVRKVTAVDANEELYQAALYAKAAIERNETVAIVVPQLQGEWHQVEWQLREVFQDSVPYNISSGESLNKQPIIFCLLETFHCLRSNTSMQTWNHLLHSPFLEGGCSEAVERAAFDFMLREKEAMFLPVSFLVSLKLIPPILLSQLQRVTAIKQTLSTPRPMREWILFLKSWIALWGWGSDRTLSSAQYQAVHSFYETLTSLYPLDELKTSYSFQAFQEWLFFAIKSTLFQTESQDKPIQVLGLLEAAGLSFDNAWIVGLTAAAYPAKASPHPFIPTHLQIQADLPHSSPEREVRVAKRLLDWLLKSASRVTLSYATQNEDGEGHMESPLIEGYAMEGLLPAPPLRLGEKIAQLSVFQTYDDSVGITLTQQHLRGGSSVLKDQAACPHAAYLKHRLMAKIPASPVMGLSSRAQGNIIHRVLERCWQDLKTRHGLIRLDEASLMSLINAHVDHVLQCHIPALSQANQCIESKRVREIVLGWLTYEKTRPDFSVISLENKMEVTLGALSLTVTMDRVDCVNSDQYWVIDYKTGTVRSDVWEMPRMDEPQLPLYAIFLSPKPAGIAFARIKKNDMAIDAIGGDEVWDTLFQQFKNDLTLLSEEVVHGYGAMQPKYAQNTCERCVLNAGCRQYTGGVYER